MPHVLLVDDEHRFLEAAAKTLRREGHRVTTADSLSGARKVIASIKPEFAFVDLMLPDGNGLELLELLSADSNCRVALITGDPSIATRVQELSGPSLLYLTKPLREADLLRVLSEPRSEEPRDGTTGSKRHFGLLIGESAGMRAVYEAIALFAASDAAVLITGETGSGKELVARALHERSGRHGSLVTLNCGGLSRELIASELFGHEKGSFTGATRRHHGMFERADGGTLFLDEITEMPLELQANLLRIVESGQVTRVGGEHEQRLDVRIVAATNRDAAQAVEQGKLRKDLYFRLAEFCVAVPPLRQRRDDIPLLVAEFAARLNAHYGTRKRTTEACVARFVEYDWPGNVRELRHILHRAFILSQGDDADIEVPDDFESPFTSGGEEGIEPGRSIRDVEKDLILKTLDHVGGDKDQAARSLGISVRTLYNRLNEYDRADD